MSPIETIAVTFVLVCSAGMALGLPIRNVISGFVVRWRGSQVHIGVIVSVVVASTIVGITGMIVTIVKCGGNLDRCDNLSIPEATMLFIVFVVMALFSWGLGLTYYSIRTRQIGWLDAFSGFEFVTPASRPLHGSERTKPVVLSPNEVKESIVRHGVLVDADYDGALIRHGRFQVLKVWNSTPEGDKSRKPYYLRVPPHIKTAREGRAWTFGQNPEDFVLEKET